MRFIYCAAMVAFVVACATPSAQQSDKTERVTRDFTILTYSLFSRPSVMHAARAFEDGGKVGICAAFATIRSGDGFSNQLLEKARGRATYTLDGDRIAVGAGFAPTYPVTEQREVLGKSARCILTEAPWKPVYRGERVRITANIGFVGS